MRQNWLNWKYAARAVGLFLIAAGVAQKDDIWVGAGVAIAFAPEGTGLGKK